MYVVAYETSMHNLFVIFKFYFLETVIDILFYNNTMKYTTSNTSYLH